MILEIHGQNLIVSLEMICPCLRGLSNGECDAVWSLPTFLEKPPWSFQFKHQWSSLHVYMSKQRTLFIKILLRCPKSNVHFAHHWTWASFKMLTPPFGCLESDKKQRYDSDSHNKIILHLEVLISFRKWVWKGGWNLALLFCCLNNQFFSS